ncbi:MAG: hypothetical protein F4X40_01835 [Chloroflexi bacterium]|nr:hypothetical protein [Chloroflexota bacterium]
MTPRVTRLRPWHTPALARSFILATGPREHVMPVVGPTPPAFLALAATIPGLVPDAQGYAAWTDDSLIGFALAEFVPDRRRANVSVLTLALSADDVTPDPGELAACAALLERLTVDAAARGYVSVFARLPRDSRFREVFSRLGFVGAVSEDVYTRRPGPIANQESISGLRPVEQADAWDISQLYRTITPAALQLAESPGGERPSVPRRRLPQLGAGRAPQEFVVDGERGLDGWLRVHPGSRGRHTAALMVHPRRAALTRPLLGFAVWLLMEEGRLPVRVVVHAHEDALRRAVVDEGFTKTEEREILVKHMTVRIAAEVPAQALDRATS